MTLENRSLENKLHNGKDRAAFKRLASKLKVKKRKQEKLAK